MANITPTFTPFNGTEIGSGRRGGGLKVTWSSITEADVGVAWDGGVMYPNKSVHVEGVTSGDTIVIEGSDDESNYLTLTDKQGGDLSFANADGIRKIEENPRLIRPGQPTGTGVSINVTITASRGKD